MRPALTIAALSLSIAAGSTLAQVEPELAAHVAARKQLMDHPSRSIGDRESIALEVASALDRAAWTAITPGGRRSAWAEARAVLDGFSSRNPGHPKANLFAFQAAVYLWAEGRGLMARAEAGDAESKARSASTLDAAIVRLRPIVAALADSSDPLAQNARYRFAQAALDRSRLDLKHPGPPELGDEALRAIQSRPFTEANLSGFADLLRADLLTRARRFDEAREALDSAAKAPSPPPEAERLSVAVAIASGRSDFAAARVEVEESGVSMFEKARLKLTLALAERAPLAPGSDRATLEADAFALASELKRMGAAESGPPLRALARAIDEPSATLGPEAWSLLAEGAALAGQADRASRLDVIAAAKAEAKGDREAARRSLFRAAAVAYGANRFARADGLFSRVRDDIGAGSLRPRAGMLRALARGRGAAAAEIGLTRAGYLAALGDQIRDFPDDPATGEARWLLAGEQSRDGAKSEADALWASIPKAHPRWLNSRVALAGLRREAIDDRRLVDDPSQLTTLVAEASKSLDNARAEARDDGERTDLDLERVRLDLTPGIGNPKAALVLAERLRRLPLRADQSERLDALRIVALAASERSLDAERAASDLAGSVRSRLELARQLDRWAMQATPDRLARRIAATERIVADRLERAEGLIPAEKAEVRLRRARGRVLAGDLEGGRALIDGWPDPARDLPADLADVADLFAQAGEPARALATYRLLAKRSPSGSPRWFAARLGQARSLFASGQVEAAKTLVEGTTLLHPDLGGPVLKASFEALRAKLSRR